MKKLILFSVLFGIPLLTMAQDDDMYFVPSKSVRQETIPVEDVENTSTDNYVGSDRDIDEYNHRGHYRSQYQTLNSDSTTDDVINFTEGTGVYPDSTYTNSNFTNGSVSNDDDDYAYSRRMTRWDGFYDPWFFSWRMGYGPFWGYSPWGYDYYGWYDSWYYGYGGWYNPFFYDYYDGWYGWCRPCYWGGGYISRHSQEGFTGYRDYRFPNHTTSTSTAARSNFGHRSTTVSDNSSSFGRRTYNNNTTYSTNRVNENTRSSFSTFGNNSSSGGSFGGHVGGSGGARSGGGSFGGGHSGGGFGHR